MSRRLMFLNVTLLALVVAGAIRLRHDVTAFSASHRVDQIQPESDKSLPKPLEAANAFTKQEWPDIAAHDPFSFDRNDVAIVVTAQAAQQPKRPKPLLYGTMSFGKGLIAMLAPGDAPPRSSRPVHAGEVFDGWTVVEIQEKTVIVKWDDVKETLIMNDPTAQLARDYSKTGSSSPASQPVVAVAPAAQPAAAAPAASSNPFAPQTPVVSPTGKKQILIHTPFGDKVMDDPSQ
ncbi:MAG TPA: hypothetical protein VKY31_05990 [Terriglobia bacterium]|nr:hypothetical protein [Terriglobia bacterium]